MKLVFILLGVSQVLGYEEDYQAFSRCGINGWSCLSVKGKYEITYTCENVQGQFQNARVWIWTARLPTESTIFTVRNCNHLEVHFDCTKGFRSSLLQQFKVINITNLEILPPMPPTVYLHDNDQVPQAPPILYMSNVKNIKLYPGVFDKPSGECNYKFIELSTLILENVHITKIMKDLFHKQTMSTLVLKNVVIDSIDSNAMSIAANSSITGTTFPLLAENAINLRGESISFINNTFKKLQSSGLVIKSREFQFSNNYIEEINSGGLDILAAKIDIVNNFFNHLETGAFQKINPGYTPLTYEFASKFIYNFSNNSLIHINPGSLHLNWDIYKKVCSDIIFKNNKFVCSCINLGWVSIFNRLGPKLLKVKEFYDTYFQKGDNMCMDHNHCPLKAVISQIHDICDNKTEISVICSSDNNVTDTLFDAVTTEFPTPTTTPNSTVENFQTNDNEVTQKVIPVLSYVENRASPLQTTDSPILKIVFPVISILLAVCFGLILWWCKRMKQRWTISTAYKNERSADADSLVIMNEFMKCMETN